MRQHSLFGDRLGWARKLLDAADPDEPTGAPGPGEVEGAILALDGQTGRLARSSDPDTSQEAVEALDASGALAGQRGAVLEALRANPGSTSAELAEAMGVERTVTGRRLPDLEAMGLARRGDKRPCRARRGRAITWEAA